MTSKELENLEKRVEKLENIYETINKLTLQVEKLAMETKYSREDLNKVISRVDVLEHKPAQKYDSIVMTTITGIVSALIGALMALIIRK